MPIFLNCFVYSGILLESDEYPGSPATDNGLLEDEMIDDEDQSEDAEIEVDSEVSDTDEENDLGVTSQSSAAASKHARFLGMGLALVKCFLL